MLLPMFMFSWGSVILKVDRLASVMLKAFKMTERFGSDPDSDPGIGLPLLIKATIFLLEITISPECNSLVFLIPTGATTSA